MWFNRCRERERDGRTQVRGTVHNKGLTHIYLMTVFCEILTNYLKVVTLLATLWHIYTANTNSHQPTQKSKKIAAQTKVHTTVLHSPRWWNMTHRNFLPTSLVGKGAVGGQRASERGPYISCIWPTCIGLTWGFSACHLQEVHHTGSQRGWAVPRMILFASSACLLQMFVEEEALLVCDHLQPVHQNRGSQGNAKNCLVCQKCVCVCVFAEFDCKCLWEKPPPSLHSGPRSARGTACVSLHQKIVARNTALNETDTLGSRWSRYWRLSAETIPQEGIYLGCSRVLW